MATVLQWQSHITDSTDRETILGNLDFLENFAGAIMGETTTLQDNFEALRTEIKAGTLKPTKWKDSKDFKTIVTQLTNASSGKLAVLEEQGEDLKTRLGTAEDDVKDHGSRLDKAEEGVKNHGTTLSGYGKRIKDAEDALGNKLDSADFDSFKESTKSKLGTLASSAELENLRTLLNKEVSHWTADKTPLPIKDYLPADQIKGSDQPWGKNEDPERHVGDLCTVIGDGQEDKGVSYRFVKNPSADSYKWTKVIDNDGALALSKQAEFETAYKKRQTAIDSALDGKQRKGNYVEQTAYDKNNTKVDQEIKTLKNTYKVTVTTQGEIRNGEIVDGTTQSGTPAILHTAHVYDILGNKVTSLDSKLTWTINKNRTTDPKQRTVTGATCYITAEDFVRTVVASGKAPCYYDIELNSDF